MPVPVKYPGVYIDERPSLSPVIRPVPTSITAFLGRTAAGPLGQPTTVLSFAEFQTMYGGLSAALPLTYAVRDFFQNGGSEAVIVRLANAAASAEALWPANNISFTAANPGAWGNTAGTVTPDPSPGQPAPAPQGLSLRIDPTAVAHPQQSGLVDVTVSLNGATTEVFRGVTCTGAASANRIDTVLASQSRLVRATLTPTSTLTADAASGWLAFSAGSDGAPLAVADLIGDQGSRTGLYQLETVAVFNTLCIPPDTFTSDIDPTVCAAAASYCRARRAMLLVDPPAAWTTNLKSGQLATISPAIFGIAAADASYVAVYAPRLIEPDPLDNEKPAPYAPCGAIAGIWAATDAARGVWHAPANTALSGVSALEVNLTDTQNGILNPLGINCLRTFPGRGSLVWGARTLESFNGESEEYRYIPTRRLTNFIESSLYEGTPWTVFEPNTEALWAQLRLSIEAFLHTLFMQGALQGATPAAAYFVRCDATTTTSTDIANGVVNIVVGFAPTLPAEFVIIQIQQLAGSVNSGTDPDGKHP